MHFLTDMCQCQDKEIITIIVGFFLSLSLHILQQSKLHTFTIWKTITTHFIKVSYWMNSKMIHFPPDTRQNSKIITKVSYMMLLLLVQEPQINTYRGTVQSQTIWYATMFKYQAVLINHQNHQTSHIHHLLTPDHSEIYLNWWKPSKKLKISYNEYMDIW